MPTKLWSENMKEGPKRRSEESVRIIPDVMGRKCVDWFIRIRIRISSGLF